jgi:hypothetical protein
MNGGQPVSSDENSLEIVYEPGVRAGWVLRVFDGVLGVETVSAAPLVHGIPTMLDIEQKMAARIEEHAADIARVVYKLGSREIHLLNGCRIEFTWKVILCDWRCRDCGIDTDEIAEYYMLLDPIWEQVEGNDRHLCIGCVENRLGRTLCASDFADVNVNTSVSLPRSSRLRARLSDMR